MNGEVDIIILNWNGWSDTVECLESLYQNKYDNYRVILVDNGSEDNSALKIKEYCRGKLNVTSGFFNYQETNKPIKFIELNEDEIDKKLSTADERLILIKNSQNQGFARGNNIGIRLALDNYNPDYILLLNNDTVVDPDFLTELINTAESNREIGFTGPKTYLYDNQNIIQTAGGGNIDFLRGESHEVAFMENDVGKYNKPLEVDYIGGSCLLVKKEVIKKVGTMDENFFMYWEDVDWCFTGRESGYKSIYSPKSKIWHKYGTSSQNYFKTYYHNRNRVYFMRKHSPPTSYKKFTTHYLKEILKESGYQLIYKRNWKLFKSLVKGTLDGFRLKIK